LNPAAARGPDGQLYLLPRLVAEGNFSRIGLARVLFDAQGDPSGVERMGVVLEPEEEYERNPETGGGVEDPRVTYVAHVQRYVMTYTAFSPQGPRIALAWSRDLCHWERLGLARFRAGEVDFNSVDNKDGVLFPNLVPGPDGKLALALIHRPLFPGTLPHQVQRRLQQRHFALNRQAAATPAGRGPAQRVSAAHQHRSPHESLWISYCGSPSANGQWVFDQHQRLLSPRASWERIKVGAGAPPLLTPIGWLLVYHGVGGQLAQHHLQYSAGVAVLDARQPHHVLYRSPRPVLSPGESERSGLVPNVVFPTGLDVRTDLGQPNRVDMYFGMADDHIGVATLHLPDRIE
ncbi:MAG: glycoside hydrolase family 130 protein, partial [Chloroflexota bacterium]